MPQTDPAQVSRLAQHWTGAGANFSTLLAAAFDYALDAVDATDAEAALAVFLLHGQGRLPGSNDLNLQVGTGLSVKVINGDAWIVGRLVRLADPEGFEIVVLPAVATTWVYLDNELEFHLSASKLTEEQKAQEDGSFWICLGSALTNSSDCLSVNMTDADILATVDGLDEEVEALQALLTQVRAAIGEVYFSTTPPAASLHQRILDIVVSNGITVYASTLQWALTDSRLLGEVMAETIEAAIADHVTLYHPGGTGDEGEPQIIDLAQRDWAVINHALLVLRLTEYADADLPASQEAAIYVVDGQYGHGENGTPDYVHPSSTW